MFVQIGHFSAVNPHPTGSIYQFYLQIPYSLGFPFYLDPQDDSEFSAPFVLTERFPVAIFKCSLSILLAAHLLVGNAFELLDAINSPEYNITVMVTDLPASPAAVYQTFTIVVS